MKAYFRTNLDEAKVYVDRLNDGNHEASDYLVGDLVRIWINRKHPYGSFPLRVCARTLDPVEGTAQIELHMPHEGQTIRQWMDQLKQQFEEVTP